MRSLLANGDPRLLVWLRVREFAVPPPMIETATARRVVGDWAGACAAARVDADVDLRALARSHGRELAAQVRADLRHLAPDLLRWHMPRVAPDGLLRPGLTVSLARYGQGVHLVARTAPAWADAGQRISLALWTGSRSGCGGHPHPHPDRRFRLDLHRCMWSARHADEFRERSGMEHWPGKLSSNANLPPPSQSESAPPSHPNPAPPSHPELVPPSHPEILAPTRPGKPPASHPETPPASHPATPSASHPGTPPASHLGSLPTGCAIHRWAAEAALLRQADGRADNPVIVRLGGRLRLALVGDTVVSGILPGRPPAYPVLPDAATWVLPDLELLRAGLIDPGQLHPLVAAALAPVALAPATPTPTTPTPTTLAPAAPSHPTVDRPELPGHADTSRLVHCHGAVHRIGLVAGVLAPLDHDPQELRREELLVALGGPPLPCLRSIDEANRNPQGLADIRARLDHGDTDGALSAVEDLLGPEAVLRSGALRDELATAADRRVTYGLYRAGLAGHCPPKSPIAHRRNPRRRASR